MNQKSKVAFFSFFLLLSALVVFPSSVQAQTVGRCTGISVSLDSDVTDAGRGVSQSDQFNTSSSYASSNVLRRNPFPGERVSFSSTGEGSFGGYWARPINSNTEDACSYYIFSGVPQNGGSAIFPNWKTGTLIRNDSTGSTCGGKYLNFDQGAIFGVNYLQPNVGWSANKWCRNVDPNTTQGYTYQGMTNLGTRCTNTCVVKTEPNFSRTYNFTGVPVCAAGTYLTQDVRLRYIVWPTNTSAFNWLATDFGRTNRTFTITTPYSAGRMYVGMDTGTGAWFKTIGTPPSKFTYQQNWNNSDWNATFPIGLVPSGNYTVQYQVPANLCVAPTAPKFTETTCNADGVITLKWAAAPGATSYALRSHNAEVAWDDCKKTNGNSCADYAASTGSVIYQAYPGHKYNVWVHSMYGSTFGPAATATINCVIPPPTNLQASCSGVTANFSWTAPSGISNYYWRLKGITDPSFYVGNEELGKSAITSTSFAYGPLKAGQSYQVWIHSQRPGVPNPNWSPEVRANFTCPQPSPTPTTAPTKTPTPTLTPTPSPTPVGYCTGNSNCSNGTVCYNNGCVPPSPTPSQVPSPTFTPSPTVTPNATPTPNCSLRPKGDANCDCAIDSADRTIWRKEYLGETPQERADFDGKSNCKDESGNDQYVCTFDAQIWQTNLELGTKCAATVTPTGTQPTGAPTSTTAPASSATTAPSSAPSASPTPSRTPTPTVPQSTAIPTVTPHPMAANNYLAVRTQFVSEELDNLSNGSTSSVTVKSAAATMFPDGCLGCAKAGQMCTQVITSGTRVVVYAPYNQGTGQCIFKVYHYGKTATSACSPQTGRTIAACTADPFPAPTSAAQ